MQSVRAVVRLGREARSAAGVKLRQPLSEVIVATDDPGRREHAARHVDLIGAELGVKSVRLATSAEEFAEVEVMPLLKLLGPKYGRDLGMIRGLLREGEFRIDDGRVQVGDWTLEPGEYELRTRAREGFSVLDGDGFAVALDTELTPELELEGEARDLIRAIQVMRQEADLEVTDRIRLTHPDGAVWQQHGDWIAAETLAVERVGGDGVGGRAGLMRLLVLGGTVFLGRHLAEQALERGHAADAVHPRRHQSGAVPAGRAPARRSRRRAGCAGRSQLGRRHRHQRLPAAGGVGLGRAGSRMRSSTTPSSPACPSTRATAARAAIPARRSARIADETVEEITDETYGPLKALCEQRPSVGAAGPHAGDPPRPDRGPARPHRPVHLLAGPHRRRRPVLRPGAAPRRRR